MNLPSASSVYRLRQLQLVWQHEQQLRAAVAPLLEQYSIRGRTKLGYLAFCRRLGRLMRHYRGRTLAIEKRIQIRLASARGLDPTLLWRIAAKLDIPTGSNALPCRQNTSRILPLRYPAVATETTLVGRRNSAVHLF
ncbi:MAG: hypothetical protein ABIK43_03550 [candidate division WOR-3 bacterium]